MFLQIGADVLQIEGQLLLLQNRAKFLQIAAAITNYGRFIVNWDSYYKLMHKKLPSAFCILSMILIKIIICCGIRIMALLIEVHYS